MSPRPGALLSTPNGLPRERRPEGPGILIGLIGEQRGTAYREAWVLSLDPQYLRREGLVLHCCASLRTHYHCAIVQALRELEWVPSDTSSLHNSLSH